MIVRELVIAHRSDGSRIIYQLPTRREVIANYAQTNADQFDPIERGVVSGGIPLVWERLRSPEETLQ